MAYDAALRDALSIIARIPNDPERARGMLDNRALWAADPLHPVEADPVACPDFMWAHLNNITYDNCIKALGTKFSSIADTVPEGAGLELLDQMYKQAEPEGLGAVEDIEKEMNDCRYVDGNDITDHLTTLQSLIKKYDRASGIPFTEEKKKRFLLKTLPSSWQTPVQNWEAGPLNFAELLTQIKDFTTSVSYLKMKEQGFAMVGGVLECYNCGGNHRVRDCPDLPPNLPAGNRQTRPYFRGKGRSGKRNTKRMSKKDASALVSMLHVLSSSWMSSDEEEENLDCSSMDQKVPEVAMSANTDHHIAAASTQSEKSISGNLTGEIVSLITQYDDQTSNNIRDEISPDADHKCQQSLMSDFDKDF